MRLSCVILIEDYLELFFGHPPSKPSLTEAHVQPIWGALTFPQDTIPTNYGSNGVSRDVQTASRGGVRPEANFLFLAHEICHAILASTHLRGTPPVCAKIKKNTPRGIHEKMGETALFTPFFGGRF